MAASPQRDTIMVSAMPTVTSSSCSTSSGTASTSSSFWLNSGSRPPVRLFFSLPCSSFVIRFSPPGTGRFSGTPPLPGACILPVAADVSILTHHRLLVKRCRLHPAKNRFPNKGFPQRVKAFAPDRLQKLIPLPAGFIKVSLCGFPAGFPFLCLFVSLPGTFRKICAFLQKCDFPRIFGEKF